MAKTPKNTAATGRVTPPPPYSAEIIASNIDLLIEILLHLPIKSLIKFKSVSKRWLSLISNPTFSLRRTGPHPAAATGLFLRLPRIEHTAPIYDSIALSPISTCPPPLRSDNQISRSSRTEILQSCNGLILYRTFLAGQETTGNYYHVYNPTTKHRTTLPLLRPIDVSGDEPYGVALAFDPAESPHYKVVCVRSALAGRSRFSIEIYSSEAGPWRPSGQPVFEADADLRLERGIYWKGAIHWMSPWSNTSSYFRLRDERLLEMPMPPVPDHLQVSDRSFAYFGESGGHFHFVDHIADLGDRFFNVYELERDYSAWFAKFRVDVSGVARAFPEMVPGYVAAGEIVVGDYLMCVLCVVRCEVEEESYLVLSVPGKVLRYCFKSGSFCKVCDVEPSGGLTDEYEIQDLVFKSSDAHQYIESLVCV